MKALHGFGLLLTLLVPAVSPAAPAEEAFRRGEDALRKKDDAAAVACFSEVIRLQPNNARAWMSRGAAHGSRRDWDRASADCTEAIRLDPSCAHAYYLRGTACFGRAEHLRPASPSADGIFCWKMGMEVTPPDTHDPRRADYDRAIADLSEAVRLDPHDPSSGSGWGRRRGCLPKPRGTGYAGHSRWAG
jgi:tetratricopeptide (TPR) repeat protein